MSSIFCFHSQSGFTPLHIAAHYGKVSVAKLLIEMGADVNYKAKVMFVIKPNQAVTVTYTYYVHWYVLVTLSHVYMYVIPTQ